ncbi:MAG: hypothetical protein LBS09_08615 [Bacteroidales bacterium]|jgi:hypothetical protein|nr:hypothetical protein [Bacteroidales bacterium]
MSEEVKITEQATIQSSQGGQPITVIVNQVERKSNGAGTAGFVLALIALVTCWIPVIGWIIWLLGFIFSFVGIFKRPRGLAIAGFVVSLIDLILLVIVIGVIGAIFGAIAGSW